MIIEEVVRQRYQGVKNEKGAWITPAFPKLIYVLEEDNIREDSEYFYLTKLCAKCSVKRLVPDYISEKMMLQNKIDANGDGHCLVSLFAYYRDGLRGGRKNEKIIYYEKRFTYVYRKTACTGNALCRSILDFKDS